MYINKKLGQSHKCKINVELVGLHKVQVYRIHVHIGRGTMERNAGARKLMLFPIDCHINLTKSSSKLPCDLYDLRVGKYSLRVYTLHAHGQSNIEFLWEAEVCPALGSHVL